MVRQFHTTSLARWKFVLSRDKLIAIQTIQNGFLQHILVRMVFSIGWHFTMYTRKSCGVMFGHTKDIRSFWEH